MEEHKKWLFTKSMEYSPKGLLQLGQVLLHPYDPNSALLPEPTLPDSIVVHKCVIPSKELQDTTNPYKLGETTTSSFPEESGRESAQVSWNCTRFEDYYMTPDSQYIQMIVQDINVKRSFSRFALRKKIFLVVAVRVVCGAYLERERHLTSDARYPALSPIESGSSPLSKYVVSSASDFVFAYKLYEISVRTKSIAMPFGVGEDFSKVPRSQHGDKLASARFAPSYKTQFLQESGHNEDSFSDEGYVTFSDDESDDDDWSVKELEVVDAAAGRRRLDTATPASKDITVRSDSTSVETKSTSVGPLFGMDSATASTSATISSIPEPFQDGDVETYDMISLDSELTVVGIRAEYASLLATDLVEQLSQSGLDSRNMEGVVKSLPNHLKEFAARIGGEGKAQIYRDIMVFCRRYRL
jgi:hypothetical protein